MSVTCPDCGEGAGYGREIGHKSDCPSLQPSRGGRFQPGATSDSEKARAMMQARWLVEKHMRDFDCFIKHPDILKQAIADAIYNFSRAPVNSSQT